MLVLSRKDGEQIVIGGDITVTVLSLANGRVRLGITAPPEVSILRQELHTRILAQEAEQELELLATC